MIKSDQQKQVDITISKNQALQIKTHGRVSAAKKAV